MNAITITIPNNVSPQQVADARAEFVSSVSSNYGAGRQYAAMLVGSLGTEWTELAHDAKGPAGDAMREERDALYALLKAAGHSNPSVKWKQIKGYALDLLKAEEPKVDGEADSEGSGKAKHTRSPQLRYVEDLTGLYKMGKREAKNLSEAQREVHTLVAAALGKLGIDISQL